MRKVLIVLVILAMLFTGCYNTVVIPVGGDGETPVLEEDKPWDGVTADISWYSPTESVFYLSNGEQLAGLAEIVNGTAADIARDSFAGKAIYLTSDIDLGGNEWTPIGKGNRADKTEYDQARTPFSGKFNGANHVISNFTINFEGELVGGENTTAIGFFSTVRGGASMDEYAYVQDVVFENAKIVTNSNTAGVVAGFSDSARFENIVVKDSTGTAAEGVAAIVGRFSGSGGIFYCSNIDTSVEATVTYNAGGIVGSVNHNSEYYSGNLPGNFGGNNGARLFYNTVDLSGSEATISTVKDPCGGIVGTYTCNKSDNEGRGNIRGNSVIIDDVNQISCGNGSSAYWFAGSLLGYSNSAVDVMANDNSYTLNGTTTDVAEDQNPEIV